MEVVEGLTDIFILLLRTEKERTYWKLYVDDVESRIKYSLHTKGFLLNKGFKAIEQ